MKQRAHIITSSAWLALAVLGLVVTLRFAFVAADDSRMAAIFSSDEEIIANGLTRMIERRSLHYGFWWYPPFYMTLSLVVDLLLSWTGVPDATAAVASGRIVSAVAYAFAVCGTALLTYRLSGQLAPALLAAVLLASVTDFYTFAITAHPDTLQVALLVFAFLALSSYLETARRRTLYLASALSGLAFVTKYAGAFMIPCLVIAALWTRRRSGMGGRAALWATLCNDGPKMAAAFVGAMVVAAPNFFLSIAAFFRMITTHSQNLGFGNVVRETRSGWHWLTVLSEPTVLGGFTMAALVVSGVLLIPWAIKCRRQLLTPLRKSEPSSPTSPQHTRGDSGEEWHALAVFLLVALFVLLFVGFLIARARMFELRYAYPALPFLCVLAFGILWRATSCLGSGSKGSGVDAKVIVRVIVQVIVVAGVGSLLPARLAAMEAIAAERLERPHHPCMNVGTWLQASASTNDSILYDHYTYVPRRFDRSTYTWGLTEEAIDRLDPQLVITNKSVRARYHRQGLALERRQGMDWYRAATETYERLESGRLAYRLVKVFPECRDTRVYAKMAEEP